MLHTSFTFLPQFFVTDPCLLFCLFPFHAVYFVLVLLVTCAGMFWNYLCDLVCWDKWMSSNFLLYVSICMFLCLGTVSRGITMVDSPTVGTVVWCTCGHLSLWLRVVCMPEEGIGEVMEKEDCIQALSGQIFMGMVSSQYQARLDIVRLIDGLVNACIRFVYFSLEDELKSKVSCLCWTPWTRMPLPCLSGEFSSSAI